MGASYSVIATSAGSHAPWEVIYSGESIIAAVLVFACMGRKYRIAQLRWFGDVA